MALPLHNDWLSVPAADDNAMVEFAFTVIVPDKVGFTQGPAVPTVKLKTPLTVGVPLIVNTPAAKVPVTPAGSAPAVIDAPVPLPAMA